MQKLFYLPIILTLFLGTNMHAQPSDRSNHESLQTATFAGGCFWCMEHLFDELDRKGIVETTVGYTGGHVENPTYEQVSSGNTGHAESIQIIYDPNQIGYKTLLEIYWKNIDPTDQEGQFCDIGSQYRSAIFYHNDEQKRLAEQSRDHLLNEKAVSVIYTEILPAKPFYPAEKYHQEYYKKSPLRYKFYRYNCGRDERLQELWEENQK
ncbi:MAG: Peptide methionine sulfoxide reductase MsrA [Chlamydiae bacterium]|nr:Peptide methionine sulfoxide reductase MsrA [Chlamydiota bacterium]